MRPFFVKFLKCVGLMRTVLDIGPTLRLSDSSLAVGFVLLAGPQSPRDVRKNLLKSGQGDGLRGILIIQDYLEQLRAHGLAVPVCGAGRNVWALSERGNAHFDWARSTSGRLRRKTGRFRLRQSNEFARRITPHLEIMALRGILNIDREPDNVDEALKRWIN